MLLSRCWATGWGAGAEVGFTRGGAGFANNRAGSRAAEGTAEESAGNYKGHLRTRSDCHQARRQQLHLISPHSAEACPVNMSLCQTNEKSLRVPFLFRIHQGRPGVEGFASPRQSPPWAPRERQEASFTARPAKEVMDKHAPADTVSGPQLRGAHSPPWPGARRGHGMNGSPGRLQVHCQETPRAGPSRPTRGMAVAAWQQG